MVFLINDIKFVILNLIVLFSLSDFIFNDSSGAIEFVQTLPVVISCHSNVQFSFFEERHSSSATNEPLLSSIQGRQMISQFLNQIIYVSWHLKDPSYVICIPFLGTLKFGPIRETSCDELASDYKTLEQFIVFEYRSSLFV